MAEPDDAPPSEPPPSGSFSRSLPLFISAAIFVAIGVAVLHFDPRYGPGVLALWVLLFALGFVAVTGGLASWLLVEEPSLRAEPEPQPRRGREETPTEVDAESVRPSAPDRSEFGRPLPYVHEWDEPPAYPRPSGEMGASALEPPEWDEEGVDNAEPPLAARLAGSLSANDALRDLDGIEQELVPRTSLRSSAPTMA